MAEGRARTLDREQIRPERRVPLRIVARSDESTDGVRPARLSSPAIPRPVLSASSDVYGVSPGAWLAAGLLYVALIGAFVAISWRATPPEPWPANEAVFRVIFEEPAPPAPAPAPPAAPEPPQSAAPEAVPPPVAEPEPVPAPQLAEPEPAPPQQAEPEPEPPPPQLAEPEPAPVALPKPPPPKPVPPRPRPAAVARPHPPPSAAPAPSPPAEPQVAAMRPPVAAAPVVPPRPISGLASNRKPDYPAEARRRGQQGRVLLRVEVSAAGAPLGVTVVSSSGHPVLDQAALRAVEGWHFNPATQAGMPVPGIAEVPIQFRLED